MMKKWSLFITVCCLALAFLASVSYASIEKVKQATKSMTARGIKYSFEVTAPGTLAIDLQTPDGQTHHLIQMGVGAGPMEIVWDGMLDGHKVPEGSYSILLSLDTGEGPVFADQQVTFDIVPLSDPISDANDGSYWSMTPGEMDDEEIWRLLTQPIYIFDDNYIAPSGHAYLYENPDGTGKRVAQIHGQSQGLHILGEPNAHGYVLVEAYSNYDPFFQPLTDEEKATAFDLKQGYIQASAIKHIQVDQEYGLLIDKLTQRMYLFQNGMRVTEFVISTGLITEGKYYRETIPGEFTTITYRDGFWNEDVYSSFGIRYNGGSLIHEVPHYIREDGSNDYGLFERDLGQKSSGNCVRVPRKPNEQGYTQEWLFDTLKSKDSSGRLVRYKVIVWDDINRVDTPKVWTQTETRK